jgi:hypothetical protein
MLPIREHLKCLVFTTTGKLKIIKPKRDDNEMLPIREHLNLFLFYSCSIPTS